MARTVPRAWQALSKVAMPPHFVVHYAATQSRRNMAGVCDGAEGDET
jgi:hypothetical protein